MWLDWSKMKVSMLCFAEQASPPMWGDGLTAGADYGQKLEAIIPPTSKLVSKLFPKLRPDPPMPKLESQVRALLLNRNTHIQYCPRYTSMDNVG